jgi:hypothetical protein
MFRTKNNWSTVSCLTYNDKYSGQRTKYKNDSHVITKQKIYSTFISPHMSMSITDSDLSHYIVCDSYIVCLWLNCTCLLHVKWEMSSLYDMYIVHVLPVKEKKKFYKEDNFSTWESFLYFVLCPEYLPLYVKQEEC